MQRGQIATQLLDAIRYLHDEKSVAHRDIKPANVLVQYWSDEKVHVKLGDFGLSKQSDDLKTFCGTPLYLAPEVRQVYLNRHEGLARYFPLVDIWSLAVLLVKLECGKLPDYREHHNYSGGIWGDTMVRFVRNHQALWGTNNLLSFILDDMLVVDPEKRQTARKCHEKALQLFRGERSADPATSRARPIGDTTSLLSSLGATEVPSSRLYPGEAEGNSWSMALGIDSVIAVLGEDGSDFVENLLGMRPLGSTQFGYLNTPAPGTTHPAAASVVSGATSGAREGSAPGLEERGKSVQREARSDTLGPELGAASLTIYGRAKSAREEEDEDPGASRRKRRACNRVEKVG